MNPTRLSSMAAQRIGRLGLAIIGAACLSSCATRSGDDTARLVDDYVKRSFLPGQGQDLARLEQDQTQKDCTATRGTPPAMMRDTRSA